MSRLDEIRARAAWVDGDDVTKWYEMAEHAPEDLRYLLGQIEVLRDRLQDFASYYPEEHEYLD